MEGTPPRQDSGLRVQVGGIWTRGVQTPKPTELHTKQPHWLQDEHVTNGKPVRPSAIIAPIRHGAHEEELVGLKERIQEQRLRGQNNTTDIAGPTCPQRSWCPICVQAKKRHPFTQAQCKR